MRRLGTTISKLIGYRRHWEKLLAAGRRMAPARAPATVPSSHLNEVSAFGSNPGALHMFTYLPASRETKPALVVALHGCTQSAASYDYGAGWSTLADRYGFALLFPEQRASNNAKACFNWFLPDDITRDRGEALSIRQMIEKMIVDHGTDRERVFVTGLSAGGAMTSVMLAAYPEVFAAGAIIAGLPYGTASNAQEAFASMFQGQPRSTREWGDLVRGASRHRGPWPRVSVWHGDADMTVRPVNAAEIVAQWKNVHGIETAPETRLVDGYPREVWRRGGEDVIEFYTITGMAHGTPLATGQADGHCGVAGPFFLDVAISSSYRIAKFWGLTEAVHATDNAFSRAAAGASEPASIVPASIVPDAHVEVIPDDRVEILDPEEAPGVPRWEGGRVGSADISAIIAKALTAAGLMKPRI